MTKITHDRFLTLPVALGVVISFGLILLMAPWAQTNEISDGHTTQMTASYGYAAVMLFIVWAVTAAICLLSTRDFNYRPASWWVVLWVQVALVGPLAWCLTGSMSV